MIWKKKILPWGDVPNSSNKKIIVGKQLIAAMSAATYPYNPAALDLEHNTVPGTPAYKAGSEPRPIIGYGEISIVEGDGVYYTLNDYVPGGRERLALYRDLSATPLLDKNDNVLAIHSVGACRNGAVPGIELGAIPLAAPIDGCEELTPFPLSAGALPPPEKQHEPETTTTKNMDYKTTLLGLLVTFGLLPDAGADDAAVTAALEKAKGFKPPESEKKSEPEKKEAAPGAAPLSADSALLGRIAALEKQNTDREKNDILAKAKSQGKVVALSADTLEKFDAAGLQTFVDGIKATVPLSALTPEHVQEGGGAASAQTENEKRIAAMCGVKEEKKQ